MSSKRNGDITWQQREAKRDWALRNPEKVREANRRYREWNRDKTNRQAAARMRKMRMLNRQAKQRSGLK